MDDKMRESISALMDDEANELEIQRLLSKSDPDDLLDTWKSFHSARDVMAGMSNDALSIDVSAGVAAAIRGEVPVSANNESHIKPANVLNAKHVAVERTHWKGLTGIGGALAACLVVAIGLWGDITPEAYQQGSLENAQAGLVINVLESDQVNSFNQYLLRHSELSAVTVSAGIAPLIRVASVNSVGI